MYRNFKIQLALFTPKTGYALSDMHKYKTFRAMITSLVKEFAIPRKHP